MLPKMLEGSHRSPKGQPDRAASARGAETLSRTPAHPLSPRPSAGKTPTDGLKSWVSRGPSSLLPAEGLPALPQLVRVLWASVSPPDHHPPCARLPRAAPSPGPLQTPAPPPHQASPESPSPPPLPQHTPLFLSNPPPPQNPPPPPQMGRGAGQGQAPPEPRSRTGE